MKTSIKKGLAKVIPITSKSKGKVYEKTGSGKTGGRHQR